MTSSFVSGCLSFEISKFFISERIRTGIWLRGQIRGADSESEVRFSKYSSRPTTITSNLSEVEMNICIIVYLFMSFVGHIEVKESPSKILKLTVYSSVYFLPQNDLFAYNTRSGSFSGLALQNN